MRTVPAAEELQPVLAWAWVLMNGMHCVVTVGYNIQCAFNVHLVTCNAVALARSEPIPSTTQVAVLCVYIYCYFAVVVSCICGGLKLLLGGQDFYRVYYTMSSVSVQCM